MTDTANALEHGRMKPLAVMLVGLLAIAFGAFALFGLSGCGANQVEVPELYLEDSATAEKLLAAANLKVGTVTEREDPSVKIGDMVVEQSVAAGTKVDEGTAIDLVISKGQKLTDPVKVPDLTGMTVDEAENALADLLLIPMPGESKTSDSIEPGRVCGQSVQAGSELMPLETVTYNVSLGTEKVAVPDVVGKPINEARDALSAAGLACDTTSSYSDDVATDVVISQSTNANEQVTKGTVITLNISLGVKPPDRVSVPNIISYNVNDAIAALNSAGLAYNYSGDEGGTVVSVDPAPGTMVDAGSTVNFTIQLAEQPQPDQQGNELDGTDPEELVWQNGLGELRSAEQVQLEDGSWRWGVVCADTEGNEHYFLIDKDGNYVSFDDDDDDGNQDDGNFEAIMSMDPEQIIFDNGLGKFVDADAIQSDDGSWYWQVIANDTEDNPHVFIIEADGSISEL